MITSIISYFSFCLECLFGTMRHMTNKTCITCAFLRHRGGDVIDIEIRRKIMRIEEPASINPIFADEEVRYKNLTCSEGVLDSFLNEGDTIQKIHKQITEASCPAKKWRKFIIGQSAQEAQQIKQDKTQIRVTIITTIIIVVVTVVFGIFNLVCD